MNDLWICAHWSKQGCLCVHDHVETAFKTRLQRTEEHAREVRTPATIILKLVNDPVRFMRMGNDTDKVANDSSLSGEANTDQESWLVRVIHELNRLDLRDDWRKIHEWLLYLLIHEAHRNGPHYVPCGLFAHGRTLDSWDNHFSCGNA